MADNKVYVTQQQENGNILISEDVIATIVANAISEVDGIVGLSARPGSDIAEMIGKKNWGKGIKVRLGENDELHIDCNINIGFGQSVVDIAKAVQQAVGAALDTAAGIAPASINVNVCGIIRQ